MDFFFQVTKCSHTLYDPNLLYKKNSNKPCLTYQSFQSLMTKMGDPEMPVPEPDIFPNKFKLIDDTKYMVPSLAEIGIDESQCGPLKYSGGETEALKRFKISLKNDVWVANFVTPNTAPNRFIKQI